MLSSHLVRPIETFDMERFGCPISIIRNFDNSNLAFVTRKGSTNKLIFQGRCVAEWDCDESDFSFVLSFDGASLAYAQRNPLSSKWEISVNGNKKYEADGNLNLINLVWLDNKILAWVLEDKNLENRARFFQNGIDVTDKFVYFFTAKKDFIMAFDLDEKKDLKYGYIIGKDGKCETPTKKDRSSNGMVCEIIRSNDKEAVVCNGITGPKFDRIHCLSRGCFGDKEVLAYAGANSSRLFMNFENLFAKIIKMRKIWKIVKNNKFLFDLFVKIFDKLICRTQSYFIVARGREWRRAYPYVKEIIPTKNNTAIVAQSDFGKEFVTIDEKEGPKFNEIYKVNAIKNERDQEFLCYLARNGFKFYRVTVALRQ